MDMLMIFLLIFLLVVAIISFLVFKNSKAHKKSDEAAISLKRSPVQIIFKEGLPTDGKGELRATISSKKTFPMIFAGILTISVLAFIWTMIDTGYKEYWLYIVLLSCVLLYYVNDILSEIKIYENALTSRSLFGVRTYYFANLDCIETFNVITRANKGVGFGYQLTKDKKNLCRFDSARFENIDALEVIFREGHSAVQNIVNLNPGDED